MRTMIAYAKGALDQIRYPSARPDLLVISVGWCALGQHSTQLLPLLARQFGLRARSRMTLQRRDSLLATPFEPLTHRSLADS